MKNWKIKLSGIFLTLMVFTYFLGFAGSYIFYLFSSMDIFFTTQHLELASVFNWIAVGLSLSLLTSLCVWPFALSVATLLEHNKSRVVTGYFLKLTSYFATIPLVIFVYVYIEVVGPQGFSALESFWVNSFASTNLLTQSIAFALTLLLYPLSILPIFAERLTIDLFFKQMLQAVIDFAEVGLVASIIVLGLFLFILPKMILHMRKQLSEDKSLRSFEIIQSIGGTSWESIHLTVMQSMKGQFNGIVTCFTRVCFFEGLITFTLLHFFFLDGSAQASHWSSSLSSMFVAASIEPRGQLALLLGVSGVLVVCYGCFLKMEDYFRFKDEVRDV